MKELMVILSVSEMIYTQIIREMLRCRGNRNFVTELVNLGSSAVSQGQLTGEAMLGKLIMSLPLNVKGRKHFKANLTDEEYNGFWRMAEVLGVRTKREILLAMCFMVEKKFQYVIANPIADVVSGIRGM